MNGCETWKLTKATETKLRTTQRIMERSTMGITLRDRKRASWVREQTRVKNNVEAVKERKWNWADDWITTTWTTKQKVFCVKTYYKTKSFKTVQAKHRRLFNFNYYPNKSKISKWVRNFETYGSVEDRRKARKSPT
ncbi:uncharacterized protein LOC143024328 [Oratosquilla oratoria]|uniref:uncharacterized protein LOC143024328 n=1 Tax=Oratosquilla oratoria TaxID=337810 RepID=UPI003F75EFA8